VSRPRIDTDVIVRLLTGDDPAKQAAAAQLFQDVEDGQCVVAAPVTVIADAVFVLCSKRLYNLPRAQAAAALSRLVQIPGFRVDRRRTVMAALALFGATTVDFGDCMIVATMQQAGSTVLFSYDQDFDRFPSIKRQEPGAATAR
jgi:predicted nucleic acid-binding protein